MTIITFPLSEVTSAHPNLRRFDARTDLPAVADLVERCFADTLDIDGKRTIQNMRSSALNPQFVRWVANVSMRAPFSLNGFVWEEEGSIVGNLSLIPMPSRRKKTILIANVAVHPDHRRHGIAKKLTAAALEECDRRRIDRIWLHVRDDNAGAVALYRQLGFKEHSRRTTWFNTGSAEPLLPFHEAGEVRIITPARKHWHTRLSWLARLHPEDLDWYLPLNTRDLQPGFSGLVFRLLSASAPRQWAAVRGGKMLAYLSWQRTQTASDRLWLALPEDHEDAAVQMLIRHAQEQLATRKPLNLEFPAGQATGALEGAGFKPHHTLIWMQRGGSYARHNAN